MEVKNWFKYRGYPHISNDIPISKRKVMERYAQTPTLIFKHSFLPLISKQIIQRRFKKISGFDFRSRSHKVIKDGLTKSSKKIRTIMYSCHQDAHIYAYYTKKIIEPKYEELLSKNCYINKSVIAYRRLPIDDNKGNKNNIYFAKEVFEEIKQRKNCVALLFDIENFFPSLDHKILKLTWAKTLGCKSLPKDHYNLFKSITKYSFINLKELKTKNGRFDEKELAEIKNNGKHAYFNSVKDFLDSDLTIYKNPKKSKGIPQGLPISALLANMYMLPFDQIIVDELTIKKNVFYRRYSDDMIFICNKNQIAEIKEFVENQIKLIKLDISIDKTEIVEFDEKIVSGKLRLQSSSVLKNRIIENYPLSYLGFEFYGYQTLIKSKNLSSFYRDMKESIARKSKRVESIKKRDLIDELPLFKRKLYRLYSYKGVKTRKLIYLPKSSSNKIKIKDYRGNFIRYALKASEVLDAPEIKHQIRNHWKILQNTIDKYDFSNKLKK
ncbi:MAG: RNA-directed DNA polymerase (Reverse transcriptase) [Flavobacteriales bacterium BRH_c54]|nr:MAG: RNA-directed DNA polymerase (Reverse transcriptase) [Flavobacteriales bacterium BRH_c54]